MVEDARYRTKVYLTHATKGINPSNLTKDDASTLAKYIVAYGNPDYPITRVFKDKRIDVIFSLGEPDSEPMLNFDQTPYGYEEHVPITTFCIDKTGITGTKLKWKAEAELRRITETYPTGSQRALERRGDNDQRLGSTILYSTQFILNYRRDTT